MKLLKLLPVSAALTFWLAATTSVFAQAPAASHASASDYGKLPLSFEANQGQTDPSVQFLSHGQGYTLFLRPGEAVLALRSAQPAASRASAQTIPHQPSTADSNHATSLVTMQLVGANPMPAVAHEDQQITLTNYFLGSDPAKWHTDIPNYGRVRYSSVYPGIDLVYYGNQRQLEHDFVVAPGTNPAKIAIALKGAKSLHIDSVTGDLILNTGEADLRLLKPVTYQDFNGHRAEIQSGYKLLAKNHIGFTVGPYNHNQPLIIDPVLVYSTYLGGSGNTNNQGDQGNGIAVDSNGNAYVVGTTYSTNFPVTTHPYQATNNAELSGQMATVFVSKLNAAGTALIYSTYLGGTGSGGGGDLGYGIAVDASKNAYVTGATYSTNFPITCGAYKTVNPSTTTGAPTAFVTKLNASGSALVFSTYLGGSGNLADPARGDVAQAIAINPSGTGDTYVTGYTYSADFPVTANAFQPEFAGTASTSNAFLTRLNAAGTALTYSTYLGGGGSNGNGDAANALSVGTGDIVAIAGTTNSSNFPVSSDAHQSSALGFPTGFVTTFAADGSQLYSTYLGGSGGDSIRAIAINSAAQTIYVAGNTTSSDFPVTDGVVEGANVGIGQYYNNSTGGGAFITALNWQTPAIEYSTYLEGQGTSVTGLAVDSAGTAYVTGNAPVIGAGQFGGFQSTPDALSVPASPSNSAFLVKLDPAASVFEYATLLGGSGGLESANSLALDGQGNVYLTGFTNSIDFPTTGGAYQTTNKSQHQSTNAFVSKFSLSSEANQTSYPNNTFPTNIATSVTASGYLNVDCANNEMSITVNAVVVPAAFGPPMTGTIYLYQDFSGYSDDPVIGGWGLGAFDSISYTTIDPPWSPFSVDWSATYSGDSVYQYSSAGGTISSNGCPPNDFSARPSQKVPPAAIRPRLRRLSGIGQSSIVLNRVPLTASRTKMISATFLGPRYTPPPAGAGGNGLANREASQTTTASSCGTTHPPLTVTAHSYSRHYGAANPQLNYSVTGLLNGDTVAVTESTTATPASPAGTYPITVTVTGAALSNYTLTVVNGTLTVSPAPLTVTLRSVSRLYGAPNPALGYFTTGLVNGDTVTVTESTTATPSSPVGSYPVTATVTGVATANYALTVIPGTLYVRPAPLYISASNVASRYGQTPPQPTAYKLTGFVNGDTAAIVSGAPILSTTVTATTPPGYYKIGVQIGTLTAANYVFETYSSGEGSVNVLKAPLQLKANNLTMTQGSAVPTLTYTLTGFVNGQSTAGTVTGAPNLSTTATSASASGHYPININPGTLASTNYFFQAVNGILTVTP